MSDQPKRRGRPPKNASCCRVAVMFRLTDAVRDRVMVQGAEAGRSMSEELERIVEAHFLASDLRQIVREEIAAAQVSKSSFRDALTIINQLPRTHYEGPVPVQIFGRDHLPS